MHGSGQSGRLRLCDQGYQWPRNKTASVAGLVSLYRERNQTQGQRAMFCDGTWFTISQAHHMHADATHVPITRKHCGNFHM